MIKSESSIFTSIGLYIVAAMIVLSKSTSAIVMAMSSSSIPTSSSLSIQPPPLSSSSMESEDLTDYYFPGAKSVTPEDLRALSRQLGTSKSVSHASIGVPSTCRCQHNYPQAFLLDPIPPRRTPHSLLRMSSSLLKLTCPLLVEAIDELEDDGGLETFNRLLSTEEKEETSQDDAEEGTITKKSNQWIEAAIFANEVHASSRNKILLDKFQKNEKEMHSALCSKLGERGAAYFKTAGVAGMTTSTITTSTTTDETTSKLLISSTTPNDVKCLHAQAADALFRGYEDAPVGAAVLDTLYVSVEGSEDCWKRCCPPSDIVTNKEVDSGKVQKLEDLLPAPPVPRNKQRKKRAKEIARKKRRRAEEKAQGTNE